MIAFLEEYGMDLLHKIGEHFTMSLSALILGCLIAIPLGIVASRSKKLSGVLLSISSLLQTIPSLALLAIMVPLLGVGKVPAIVALCIYSLLPILRNTVLGMEAVDKNTLDAAKGMGMTRFQQIWKVQLPLAFDVMMSGIRLSATYVIAWTSLAAYIGTGGLGDYIFMGLNNYNISMIVAGTIPGIVMALAVDLILGKFQDILAPKYERQGGI